MAIDTQSTFPLKSGKSSEGIVAEVMAADLDADHDEVPFTDYDVLNEVVDKLVEQRIRQLEEAGHIQVLHPHEVYSTAHTPVANGVRSDRNNPDSETNLAKKAPDTVNHEADEVNTTRSGHSIAAPPQQLRAVSAPETDTRVSRQRMELKKRIATDPTPVSTSKSLIPIAPGSTLRYTDRADAINSRPTSRQPNHHHQGDAANAAEKNSSQHELDATASSQSDSPETWKLPFPVKFGVAVRDFAIENEPPRGLYHREDGSVVMVHFDGFTLRLGDEAEGWFQQRP